MKTIKSASLTGRGPRTTVPLQGQAAEPEAHNNEDRSFESLDTAKTKSPEAYGSHGPLDEVNTHKLPQLSPQPDEPVVPARSTQKGLISGGRAIVLASFLLVVLVNAANIGSSQFIGTQGWAFILSGASTTSSHNLLKDVANQFRHTPIAGTRTQTKHKLTPVVYINAILQKMTLDEKLGQMMIVQFYGSDYGLDISTMTSQYKVGAVLIYAANNNIVSRPQLKGLVQQMQQNSTVPMVVAIDQEGGTVDRLMNLDGSRPSATSIGATGDPAKAMAEGIRDANDLSYYGINLNLAPVVDVTNVYNPQLYLRTFGDNAATVINMAGGDFQSHQHRGKGMGKLKHLPTRGGGGSGPPITLPSLLCPPR